MKFTKEILAPFSTEAFEIDVPVYARIDLLKNSDLKNFLHCPQKNKTPVLFLPSQNTHPTRMDENYVSDLTERHMMIASTLLSQGITDIVIATDNDGAFHQLLSPRFRSLDVIARAEPLCDLYSDLCQLGLNVDVLLQVEDLAPGGLDATDGVMIARELATRGLKHVIATAGTKDFPPLFDRRATQKKRDSVDDFISREPALASALWLLEHTELAISCYASIDNKDEALTLAHQLGLNSLVEKAQTIDV
jgi:hypothetical protein